VQRSWCRWMELMSGDLRRDSVIRWDTKCHSTWKLVVALQVGRTKPLAVDSEPPVLGTAQSIDVHSLLHRTDLQVGAFLRSWQPFSQFDNPCFRIIWSFATLFTTARGLTSFWARYSNPQPHALLPSYPDKCVFVCRFLNNVVSRPENKYLAREQCHG
jgi:hypothetical protein